MELWKDEELEVSSVKEQEGAKTMEYQLNKLCREHRKAVEYLIEVAYEQDWPEDKLQANMNRELNNFYQRMDFILEID